MNDKEFNKLFYNMCCSVCGHDFNYDAIKVKRNEKGLKVLEIICPECGKNFGIALLGLESDKTDKDETPFEFVDCPVPVEYDEVLSAHEFIEKLDKDWIKHLPEL